MKEDIEILEHIAIAYKDDETVNKSLANIVTCNLITNGELAKAIENLIKAYKELEENCKKCVVRERLNEYVGNSISKDKIREKIKGMQIWIDTFKENEETSEYKEEKNYWHKNKMEYVHKRNILEELLEE